MVVFTRTQSAEIFDCAGDFVGEKLDDKLAEIQAEGTKI
jgi:hypothetical protein